MTTLCVQHNVWLSPLDNVPSNIFLQVAHSNLHQTLPYLIIFWLGLFISYDSKTDYKWMFRPFYFHNLNDLDNQRFQKIILYVSPQKLEYSTMEILKLLHHLLKLSSQIYMLPFLIISKLLLMLCLWLTWSISLGVRFLPGEIYVLETSLVSSRTLLNLGFWERLKERLSEIIISSMEIIR